MSMMGANIRNCSDLIQLLHDSESFDGLKQKVIKDFGLIKKRYDIKPLDSLGLIVLFNEDVYQYYFLKGF